MRLSTDAWIIFVVIMGVILVWIGAKYLIGPSARCDELQRENIDLKAQLEKLLEQIERRPR